MPNVAVIDIETSGLEPWHEINQIACVVFNNGKIVESFERKIRFDVSLAESEALRIMHYDPEVWEREAVSRFDAMLQLIELLHRHGDRDHLSNRGWWSMYLPVMGHHIWKFDLPKLYSLAEDLELFLPVWPHPLDTYQYAVWQFYLHMHKLKRSLPMNFKLETLASWFGIRYDRPHDALEDCLANLKVARALATYFREL